MATIDLTKQEVVDVLADFEERLPNIGTELYVADPKISFFDLTTINTEAAKMLRFMNVGNYVPIVRLADLSHKSAAGQAHMGDLKDEAFEIDIDPSILYNTALTYRVLAHEICHKYLEVFGLFTKVLPKLDEVRAELCAIFMGFGGLVLNGYTETSGYLNLEDFCHAFCVVYQSRGISDAQIVNMVPQNCKELAKRILSEMNDLKSKKLSELIIAGQRPDYELRRRIRTLQLVFENMPDIKEKHFDYDKIFRDRQKELADGKHPILEMLLRETLAIKSIENDDAMEYCAKLDKMIADLCSTTKVDINNVSEGLSKDIVCPACGFVNAGSHVDGLKALKCPHCHHYFVWDGRPFELPKPQPSKKNKGFWSRLWGKK